MLSLDELRPAREPPSPPSPPFTCPSLAPRHSAGAIDMKLVWENGLPTRGRSARRRLRCRTLLSGSCRPCRELFCTRHRMCSFNANAAMGHCGVTEDAGDCMRGDAGSVTLDEMEVANWEVAIHVCRKLLRLAPPHRLRRFFACASRGLLGPAPSLPFAMGGGVVGLIISALTGEGCSSARCSGLVLSDPLVYRA